MSTSTSSTSLLQDLVGDLYSRRLLLIHSTTVYQPPSTAEAPSSVSGSYAGDNSFDANVIMVLSVLLCALICSLGLNSIIRCALRCSAMVSSHPGTASTASDRLVNTGVKRKALKSFTTVSYSAELNLPGLDTECVICLSDFIAGERVRLLPKCHHGFHVRCIDKWLSSHSSCPTCRDCLIETCQKIAGATTSCTGPVGPSELPAAVLPVTFHEAHVVTIIEPLEPEGIIRNYRGIS